MDTLLQNQWLQEAESLSRRGFNTAEISAELLSKGAPEQGLQQMIEQVRNLRLLRKRNTGFVCCGIGVFLLVFGCLITIFMWQQGANIRLVMYALTGIGVVFAIKGLADITGW